MRHYNKPSYKILKTWPYITLVSVADGIMRKDTEAVYSFFQFHGVIISRTGSFCRECWQMMFNCVVSGQNNWIKINFEINNCSMERAMKYGVATGIANYCTFGLMEECTRYVMPVLCITFFISFLVNSWICDM